MSIGVAIIGGGIFSLTPLEPAVQAASSHLTLKAIYSRSIKSAKALEANVDLYSDDSGSGNTYYDLLLRDDIQAVILALPIPAQPEYVEAALAAGKHVLSEKPIAKDITSAQKLIDYYKSDKVKGGATWGVAENFRFLDSFLFARQEVQKLGRVLGFRVKMFGNVQPGSKYFETAWRKKPEYQGGFLLDGGVHFIAATRLLLGEEATPTALTAFTTLLQEHLPPVDTVNSVWQTKTGISGTFSVSFGTTLSGSEYVIACEKGSVAVEFSKVTVRLGMEKDKKETVKEFKEEGAGVKQEVAAWAKSLSEGTPNPGQAPEQALADLEILEKMLKSGENQGAAQSLKYQL
ncbi:NAD(P)-binding Rossmann-fold containing protein [Glarea lozoyensis ATCC 20868]|uniref:NAD(P)-binding Rossmann-fold containing protein n=1 Tax=Glarea lozoyensis (strain ATCC 20868 / MF5171) TaxID=1116229 RepID=S3D733_GLAL2|nr:NAD(P)-binding Rossmann-fold containing protein [Glarea lozoyensis ATCC 20868]EPE27801.1 NAD(P)-binding Rossmann-fold containing protein [Glarea lozoyensis ATCC 20868]